MNTILKILAILGRMVPAIAAVVALLILARVSGMNVPDWAAVAASLFLWGGLELEQSFKEAVTAIREDTRQLADVMYILDPSGKIREEAESARCGRLISQAAHFAEKLKAARTAKDRRLANEDLKWLFRELEKVRGGERFYAENEHIFVETPGGPLELRCYRCEDCKREDSYLFFDDQCTLEEHRERLHRR